MLKYCKLCIKYWKFYLLHTETERPCKKELVEKEGKKFKWGKVIKQILKEAPSHTLKMKKLQKKVLY